MLAIKIAASKFSALKKTWSKSVFVMVISPASSGRVKGNSSPETQRGGNATPKTCKHTHSPAPRRQLTSQHIASKTLVSVDLSVRYDRLSQQVG